LARSWPASFFAPRFNRINGRLAATAGFATAALAFLFASTQSAFGPLAAAHAVAGFSAGTALSFTHGTIGRSTNPHRLFAILGTALGVFSILFLGAVPNAVAVSGGAALFLIFAGVMAVAAVVAALFFPRPPKSLAILGTPVGSQKIGRAAWAGILGVSTMALVQAMVFSFVQQIGTDRGFGSQAVTGILITLGFVNLFPAPLAALLEKRLEAEKVVLVGPVLQAMIALLITLSASFVPMRRAASSLSP
jgi:predicted MFS family arabinose efflux permease